MKKQTFATGDNREPYVTISARYMLALLAERVGEPSRN